MLLKRAHYTLHSKKRTKLQLFFDTRKNFVFFLTFFLNYLRARNIFTIFARFFDSIVRHMHCFNKYA